MMFYLHVDVGIYGTLWILFIAYVTRFMPYGIRYSIDVDAADPPRARRVGGDERRVVVDDASGMIVLPLLKPGLVAGWIYIAIVSVRELSSSILLYRPGTEVRLDRDLGDVGERPVRRAVGARRAC